MSNPGCFAAASVFAHDSAICQNCHVFTDCSAESLETLKTIQGLVNVKDLMKRHLAARKMLDKPITVEIEMLEPQLDTIAEPVKRETAVDKVMFVVTYEQEKIIKGMTVKSKEFARRLCENYALDTVKSELQEGRNALSLTKPRFIAVTLDRLLSNGFSRAELKAFFVESFNWGESTASSHVSIVLPLLTGFGLAKESNGRFVVAPASSA